MVALSNGIISEGSSKKPKLKGKKRKDAQGLEALDGIIVTPEVKKQKLKKKLKDKDDGVKEDVAAGLDPQNGTHETSTKNKEKTLDKEPKHDTSEPTKKKKKDKGKKEKSAEESPSVVPDAPSSLPEGDMTVTVAGTDGKPYPISPFRSFSDVKNVPASLLQVCSKFQRPSPIQSYAWPILLEGKDFVGIAKTGSGKTLAFGIPALNHVLKKVESGSPPNPRNGPHVLIMAPTRELAQQIAVVMEEAGAASKLNVACIYGGAPKGPQKKALSQGVAVVVATPGRLQDLMEEGVCSLSSSSFVVLDEADRMLDLGFEPAIRAILAVTHKPRHTVMLSATWPSDVSNLASEFLKEPVKVTIGSQDLTANHDVTQIVEVVEDRARDARLLTLLQKYHKSRQNRVLVFVLYKKEAVRVENMLQSRGWQAAAVHGDKAQNDRTRAVNGFRDGSCPLLIATDVAARGLDIPDVEYVINYSFPLTTEDYVHRIGRTGRAGKKGIAHTFFTQTDKARAGELVNVLREAGQTVPDDLLKFGTAIKKKESKLYGAHFKEIGENAPKATKITFDDSDDE